MRTRERFLLIGTVYKRLPSCRVSLDSREGTVDLFCVSFSLPYSYTNPCPVSLEHFLAWNLENRSELQLTVGTLWLESDSGGISRMAVASSGSHFITFICDGGMSVPCLWRTQDLWELISFGHGVGPGITLGLQAYHWLALSFTTPWQA